MTLADRIEAAIVSWEPAARRRAAIHLLLWSVGLMVVNVGLYLVGVIGQRELILITLVLSWFAVTVTALDIVATTDVREAEETT